MDAVAIWTRWHMGGNVIAGSSPRGVAAERAGGGRMQVRLLGFGTIEVDGQKYDYDIVIDGGEVRKRKKKPSKPRRDEYGHTPLSAAEELPWGGGRLIIGTGAHGSLPITPDVLDEARRRGVDVDAVPTVEACRLLAGLDSRRVHAVLHVTC
jgi:hypothetical protein